MHRIFEEHLKEKHEMYRDKNRQVKKAIRTHKLWRRISRKTTHIICEDCKKNNLHNLF